MIHVLRSIQVLVKSYTDENGQYRTVPVSQYITECGVYYNGNVSNEYVSVLVEKWPDTTFHRESTCHQCYALWTRFQVLLDALRQTKI